MSESQKGQEGAQLHELHSIDYSIEETERTTNNQQQPPPNAPIQVWTHTNTPIGSCQGDARASFLRSDHPIPSHSMLAGCSAGGCQPRSTRRPDACGHTPPFLICDVFYVRIGCMHVWSSVPCRAAMPIAAVRPCTRRDKTDESPAKECEEGGVAIPPPKSRLLLVLTASSPRGSVKVLFPPSWMSRQSDVQNQRVHCSRQVNEEDVSGLPAGVSRSQDLFAVRSETRAQNFLHKRRSVSCEELANLSIWDKPTNEQGLGAVSKPPPSNSPKRRGKSKNLSTEDRARGWENPTATAGGCAGGW